MEQADQHVLAGLVVPPLPDRHEGPDEQEATQCTIGTCVEVAAAEGCDSVSSEGGHRGDPSL